MMERRASLSRPELEAREGEWRRDGADTLATRDDLSDRQMTGARVTEPPEFTSSRRLIGGTSEGRQKVQKTAQYFAIFVI